MATMGRHRETWKGGCVVANLECRMLALRNGEIGFGEYMAQTRAEYGAMARSLLRRWRGPAWYQQHDVEQELYLATWRQVRGRVKANGDVDDWDPKRCPLLSRWVIFGAMTAAKRELHRARGVSLSGNPHTKPSCFEIPSALLDNRSIEAQGYCDPEEEMMRAENVRLAAAAALAHCDRKAETRTVLAIMSAGSVDGAALALYEDLDTRVEMRLGDEVTADRFVRRHAMAVARRLTAAGVDAT